MDKICLNIALCFFLCCHGLELNLDNPGLPTAQTSCRVLTCEERIVDINTSSDAKSLFSSIASLKIFKINRNDNIGERSILLGSVSTETPNVTLVTNDAKIFGVLDDKQAKIQVELFKPDDCQSEYSCQTLGVDSQGEILSSIIKHTQHGQQTRSPVDRDRRIKDRLEQLERSVHDVTKSLNNFVLQYRTNNKLTSLQKKTEELERAQRVRTQNSLLIEEISGKMDEFGSDLQNSLLNSFLSTVREGQDSVSDAPQGCREFGKVLATTSTTRMESMNRELDQVIDAAQNNQLALTKQIKSLNESIGSLQPLDMKPPLEYNISGLKDIVSEIEVNAANDFQSIIMDILRPTVCEKGMVPFFSHGSFPYPVIYPSGQSEFQFPYLCDPVTDAGGWIVIQRRSTGKINFHRNWVDYRTGFGFFDDDFWLGNDNIHAITRTGTYELRVDLRYKGKSAFARYSHFSVSDELSKFTLRVGKYSGTAGNPLDYHNNCAFSTFDRDNDLGKSNCAESQRGGWWFNKCDNANLNGDWGGQDNKGMEWDGFVSTLRSVDFSEMKIRKVG
ncbi:hypothetical protein RRG08_059061 [Elysia crispata]|uniref:Fibrinogen C-terminal domain-containing protein n=1 Tax=Elysia crispata TaxID=231223 RepID=A0AAE1DTK0_9GAST|nr:hypothetical protein RRG08_059061 [Elysia crispata]